MVSSLAPAALVALVACYTTDARRLSVIPPPPPDTAGAVFTATKIFNTIVDVSPYLTQATTTVVWTESAAPTSTAST
ncbi:hypothetical protein FIBSPDRAFT_942950 [Athelia psychrophila]|uniref:Uncharacterized protein n=1 Tax=Athelia psychrophila TaxID=1759441 RepID=A0A166WJU4_9AGAM|nr:hypothetical protein FIBSPDRAFT_942950 [Fibularhizoctonia sp. CBS 109695]